MPTPKASAELLTHWASRTPLNLNTDAFFTKSFDEKKRKEFEEKIEAAIRFYCDQTTQPKKTKIEGTTTVIDTRSVTTMTDRKGAIKPIKSEAWKIVKELRKAASKTQPERICPLVAKMEGAYRAADENTRIVLQKNLGVKDADFHRLFAALRFQHLRDISKAQEDLLKKIAGFTPPAPNKKEVRWANPALAHLLSILIPIWLENTGGTHRRINIYVSSKGGPNKKYPFADAVICLLKQAGCNKVPTKDQIDIICQKIPKKKKHIEASVFSLKKVKNPTPSK